jgi:hypothetical protein
MRSCLAVVLALFCASPLLSQAWGATPKLKKSPAKATVAKPGTESWSAVPDSDDEISKPRMWKNSVGDHLYQAALESVAGDAVTLRKADDTVITVPLKKLNAEDQDLIREFVATNSKKEIGKALEAFFATDFGDTDARVAENEQAAVQKLCGKLNGRPLRLVYAIKNVTPRPQGLYELSLGAPDFPGHGWRYINSTSIRLTKAEALKIGPDSHLVIEGKIRVQFAERYRSPAGVLQWETGDRLPDASSIGGIGLLLENQKMKVQNPAKGQEE